MVAKTENGWGSVHNGGITGGAGGVEIEFTDFVAMYVWMNDNKELPAIVTYTGSNFDATGLPTSPPFTPSTVDFEGLSRFWIGGLKNKTIRASQGQTLIFCNIQFRSSENIIWENWTQIDSLDDLIGIQTNSINIWIRHCTLNSNVFNQSNAPTDGACDITLGSNYIAVTDCLFLNCDKTMLISASNDEPNDIGKMKVTIRRCKFLNCIQRKPAARYGQIGFEYSIIDDSGLTVARQSMGVGLESRFFVYRSTFRAGINNLFRDRFGVDDEVNEDNWGALRSVENVIAPGISASTEIRPELVEADNWDPRTEPNYTLEDWTAAEAETYVEEWAGATMHLMSEIPPPTGIRFCRIDEPIV